MALVAAVALAVAAVAAAAAGARPFGLVVAAAAAAGLVDVSGLLGRAGARPVLLAAALSAVVLPAAAVLDPAGGWERAPGFLAGTLLGGFFLALAFGRRAGVTAAIAATSLAALLIGLGATALIELRSLEAGFRWTLAVVLFAAVPPAAGAVASRLPATRRLPALAAPAVAAAAVAGALIAAANPPLAPLATVALGVVTLAGVAAGAALTGALAAEADAGAGPAGGPEAEPGGRAGANGRRPGVVFPLVAGALTAAPAAYLVARAVQG